MDFASNSSYTLGVEIEFQILDRAGFRLVPFGPMLLDQAPNILRPRLSLEFIKSILEIRTGVCTNVRDVENDLLQTIALAEELAEAHDFLLYAASLHPFARGVDQELAEDPRYERIMEELQIVGRRFISQGLHVHVGLPDGDSAIKVCNLIQPFLPIFLVLSCSSPFYQSIDTGLMSYRTKLSEVLPLAGIYEHFRDWAHFVEVMEGLASHGIIEGFRDLWFDARPNPELGTLEIRICDLPVRFTEILALVAMIQSCVAWLAEQGEAAGPMSGFLLKANKWQAARHGLEGRFVDPAGILGAHAMKYRLAAMVLKRKLNAYAAQLGSEQYMNQLDTVISGGTGADRMRHIYRRSNDFAAVVRDIHEGFWQ